MCRQVRSILTCLDVRGAYAQVPRMTRVRARGRAHRWRARLQAAQARGGICCFFSYSHLSGAARPCQGDARLAASDRGVRGSRFKLIYKISLLELTARRFRRASSRRAPPWRRARHPGVKRFGWQPLYAVVVLSSIRAAGPLYKGTGCCYGELVGQPVWQQSYAR
jgi:hypothetical protein